MFAVKRFIARIEKDFAFIEAEELNHLKNVLRLKEGDEVIVLNGNGNEYLGKIFEIDKNKAQIAIKSQKTCENNPRNSISLFISAIKREKLELVVQKAVECGVKKLYIFESKFSAMKLSGERLSRYEKIMFSSLKQCERADAVKIEILSFKEMISLFAKCKTKLFANEREGESFDFSTLKNAKDIGILVGCEGGFSADEKKEILKCKPENISLGNRILRAETAAILLSGIASLFSGN